MRLYEPLFASCREPIKDSYNDAFGVPSVLGFEPETRRLKRGGPVSFGLLGSLLELADKGL